MYILNDYSIDNQFETLDTFLDSVLYNTIPLFNAMEQHNIELLKSHEIYDLKIVNGLTLFELLTKRNYPEITKLKTLLCRSLIDNPYWEKDYEEQDCINKAYKLKVGLISFEHTKYIYDNIKYSYNGTEYIISNSYNKNQLLEELRTRRSVTVGEYFQTRYSNIQSFCFIDDKDYFAEFVNDNEIKSNEVDKIVRDLKSFMEKYLNKQDLGRLSKNLEPNLNEFRTTIDDSREIRILYCINNSKLVFLNCFVKKQKKTPAQEKNLGKKLRDIVMG